MSPLALLRLCRGRRVRLRMMGMLTEAGKKYEWALDSSVCARLPE